MIGFYHKSTAIQLRKANKDPMEIAEHMYKAVLAYMSAAEVYPEDDELHVCMSISRYPRSVSTHHDMCTGYLHCSLDCMYKVNTPVKHLLKIHERISLAIPEMKRVWEHSSMSMEGRDAMLAQDLISEERLRKELAAGTLIEDALIGEQDFLPPPPAAESSHRVIL